MSDIKTSDIMKYMWLGKEDKNWYEECQKSFKDIFGEKKLDLVCKLFAATSINTSLKANITLFRKALYEIENDLPVGNYLPNIQQQLNKIRSGKELTGRKIRSFAQAMSGDKEAVVVDIWILRAFGVDKKYFRRRHSTASMGSFRNAGATDRQYSIIEEWIREKAHQMKIEPRELCSMIWSGIRVEQSGDRQTRYSTILRRSFDNLFNVI